MQQIEEIAERIRLDFEARTAARDQALSQTRTLTRYCANAIRAVHRDEYEAPRRTWTKPAASSRLCGSSWRAIPTCTTPATPRMPSKNTPRRASCIALIANHGLPMPEELGLEYATYLKGLAETGGELRRRCLDILRHGHSNEAERLLSHMDDIYAVLVTMDYPDAITGGLRRLTDIVRGINERTRGDMTISLRQEHLEKSLERLEKRLDS